MPRGPKDSTIHSVERVLRTLRGAIEQGNLTGGMRLPSEDDLCREFGTKRHAVRTAIAALAREGLIDRRSRRLGTFVADPNGPRKRPRTGNIALVSSVQALPDGLGAMGLHDLRTVLRDRNYRMFLEVFDEKDSAPSKLSDLVDDRCMDGVILLSAPPTIQRHFARRTVPCVSLGQTAEDVPIPYVTMDNFRAGYEPTAYLLDRGHRRIALVDALPMLIGHRTCAAGYEMAHHERSIPVRGEFEIQIQSDQDLERCVETIVDYECTAIELTNALLFDELSWQLTSRNGRLANGIEWVVHRNLKDWGRPPHVSAVLDNRAATVKEAVTLLVRMIEGEKIEDRVFTPVEFRPVDRRNNDAEGDETPASTGRVLTATASAEPLEA